MWTTIASVSLILLFLVVMTRVRSRQREQAWERWATDQGLSYLGPPQGPKIVGSVDQHPLEISTDQQGSDTEGGVAVVRVTLGLNQVPEEMEVVGIPGFVGDLIQGREGTIETGDREFDHDVLLKGPHPQELLAYWTPERRRAILDLVDHSEYDHVSLINSDLVVEFRSIIPGAEDLDQSVLHLREAGSILEESP
ncbi:MAG: hypothetical protein HUJ26_00890 [Planctomycetaceae bacterium]|nr:hypothetical protein [Planctomycetaceae bacterium]